MVIESNVDDYGFNPGFFLKRTDWKFFHARDEEIKCDRPDATAG